MNGYQGVSQEKKNYVLCMNWEITCCWGSGYTASPSLGSVGDQGTTPLKNLQ